MGKVVRYAEVARSLQQCHSRTLTAHAALQRRYAEVEAARAAAGERLESAERENIELRELGALLSSVVQVRRQSLVCSGGGGAGVAGAPANLVAQTWLRGGGWRSMPPD